MVAFSSQENLEKIKEWFARLACSMEGNTALKHQDANIRLEYFFRDLLNTVFEWNLVNANSIFSSDQDSFDLADAHNGVAVQVTTTTSSAKIRKTLKTFIGRHQNNYPRLKFSYPVMRCPKSSAKFDNDLNGFDFDINRDRIDFGFILRKIADLPVVRQKEILTLVADQLEPLGRPLQFGTDDILDTLVEVITYMTTVTKKEDVSSSEIDPDYDQKRNRLATYISYIEQQYTIHASLYSAVTQAREAIGYDQVVAARIQAWLQGESVSLLMTYDGNASKAFDALVEHLLEKAHQQAKPAQKTAIRFLLADEFMRCNVFPNP
jgi:hypothetical protein